jgi:hypothetical protein
MNCPSTKGCPLFPLFKMRSSLGVWQTHYCEAAFESCERYKLSKSGVRVPPNLLPNGKALDFPGLKVG